MNQLRGESNNEYEIRKKFNKYLLSKNINDSEKLAKIYMNIKFRDCRYTSKMYNYILKLEKDYNANVSN